MMIVSTPGTCSGEPCIEGTRIAVRNVLGALTAPSACDIARRYYPQLTEAQVVAAVEYAMGLLMAKPEKPARGPIVGWRVRIHIGGVRCEYVDFSSGDPDGWSDVDGKPKPMPRSDALRLRRMARRWADRIGSSWEFRLHPVRTRPTRRGGVK